jgi:hypothetical protein
MNLKHSLKCVVNRQEAVAVKPVICVCILLILKNSIKFNTHF